MAIIRSAGVLNSHHPGVVLGQSKAFAVMAILMMCFIAIVSVEAKKEVIGQTRKNPVKFDGPVVGIDLGTTFSVVAIYRGDKVEVIPNDQGNRITPSVLSFDEASGQKLVGDAAKNNAVQNPQNTFYDVKRLIGRRYGEVLNKDAKLLSYGLVNRNGRVYVDVQGKPTSPEEISAQVLVKMKQIAEKYLGEPVKHAVITVPAYFNDQQRQATKDAGRIAGLNVVRIVNEPTAAAMAYGLYKKKEENVLVFDLGGGTFDVSLLTIDRGVFEVIATNGDTHLGGEDFDHRTVDLLISLFTKKHPEVQPDRLRKDLRAFQRLKRVAEEAKRTLSSETSTKVELDNLIDGIDLSLTLTRAQFENANKDLFKKTLIPVQRVLKDANLEKKDVDEVVLVGGSTRIPYIRQQLSEFFEGKKLNFDVNPDEAIAVGAAVQAAVLAGTIADKDIVLIDVTPLSLGIETVGGVMATIIPRNTPIPTEKSDVFTTTHDYQTQLSIPIYEGERRITKFNRLLGELQLTDIPPAPKGVPQIKVIFQLDTDGILKVIAEDQATKNRKEIEIKKGTLTDEEIEQMTTDAESNEQEDRELTEKVEARNKLEAYIGTLRQQLATKNIANRLKSQDKNALIEKLRQVLRWLKHQGERATVKKEHFVAQYRNLRKFASPIFSKIFGGDPLAEEELFGDEFDDDFGSDSTVADDDDFGLKTDDAPISEDDKPISDDEKPISDEAPKKDEL
ncbi:hypothetical protein C9374_002340 [Naegleria lovaniensis]|uniref:Heat shock protein 70 n=1 Tax=Naegleria lovaniensis TaxID=51637 RepID=A0AA88GQM4_NAELO|nr:uncharacterized protein C9374_002340 [Naegleria lovaniensis]KAG2386596.1 hypothetical protein C9374_002340 [Naegleria lovaniensis]